jgi:hypothetical protein
VTLSPEVLAIAEAQAAKDRELLAALQQRDGKIGTGERRVRLIPRRAGARTSTPVPNPTIIPKGKRRKKRR